MIGQVPKMAVFFDLKGALDPITSLGFYFFLTVSFLMVSVVVFLVVSTIFWLVSTADLPESTGDLPNPAFGGSQAKMHTEIPMARRPIFNEFFMMFGF
jgi:hypothetical protein